MNEIPLPNAPTSRRTFLLAGVSVLLAGCSSPQSVTRLPGPILTRRSGVDPLASPTQPTPSSGFTAQVLSRSRWALGRPEPSLMNRMLPVRYITIHHDGMTPFFSSDYRSSAGRLETIRRSHRRRGWGDIGYHFAIDRDGRLWQGRELNWQGAHVKDRNEGNIGVVMLGNFDQQSPTVPQVASLRSHLSQLMGHFQIPVNRVYTHQEWPGAVTACPGKSLQKYMSHARSNGYFG